MRKTAWSMLFPVLALPLALLPAQGDPSLQAMHAISSNALMAWVEELCQEKYRGRLTGTPEYNSAAEWLAAQLQSWSVKPAGDGGAFFQSFPDPYTLVLPGAELSLHLPQRGGGEIVKRYGYQDEYFPGATSDAGEVTAEVVYVGYGISALELACDDYRGVDVKGKIVLVEVEVPVSPEGNADLFKKWRPYSFHQYKIENARRHGAAGMIYHYPIANPNAPFAPGLLLAYVGDSVVADLFAGTGRDYRATVAAIRKTLRPRSFSTGKKVTIKNNTRHHPEGVGINVIGRIEGSDPMLRQEAILIGAHLDHVGMNHELMPGANDNASGVAVAMGVAQAFGRLPAAPKRSLLFVFFGAEEQGVKGSEFFLEKPAPGRDRILAFINLDGVGRGDILTALAAKNFPWLWEPFARNNERYIHREVRPVFWANIARQRLDAAHFVWANIPSISFASSGGAHLPFSTYHTTRDRPEYLTPEIMEDLSRLIFLAVLELANQAE